MSPLFTFFFDETTSAASASYGSIVSNAGGLTENWSCWIHPCYKIASHGFRVEQDHGLKSFIKTSPVLNDCPACCDEWVVYVVLIGYSLGFDGIIWPSLYSLRVQVINDESWLSAV